MTDDQIQEMWKAERWEELVAALRGLAVTKAKEAYQTMGGTECSLDDVISWALESMWTAIQNWKPETGVPLRGWIAYSIPKDIKDIQEKAMSKRRGAGLEITSLEQAAEELITEDPEDGYINRIDLQLALAKLPSRLRRVLELTAQGATLQEIGDELGGVTRERARQLLVKAQARMKVLLHAA